MSKAPDNALRPCPFCGSAKLSRLDARDFIACTSCGAEGPMRMGQGSEDSMAAWNRRSADAELQRLREALVSLGKDLEKQQWLYEAMNGEPDSRIESKLRAIDAVLNHKD